LEWISLALFSAALFGVITTLEKRLIDHHLPNLGVYYASIAYSLLIPAAIVFFATGGVPDEATNLNMGWAALSGGTWGVGLAMVFWGYKLEEASRASAIVHTFPVFVAIGGVYAGRKPDSRSVGGHHSHSGRGFCDLYQTLGRARRLEFLPRFPHLDYRQLAYGVIPHLCQGSSGRRTDRLDDLRHTSDSHGRSLWCSGQTKRVS